MNIKSKCLKIISYRNELTTPRTPGPAAYPFEEYMEKDPMKELPSIYPKDKGNIFSMRKKK